jgi:hypothetical protein
MRLDANRLKRAVAALPWPSIGVAGAVVVVGISQIFFTLLRENADYFPKEPWFHLGVLFWIGALPFGILLALDLGLNRWAPGWGFRIWRAALYTFVFASMLRQAQVYHPAPFQWLVERIPPRPLLWSLLALVFLLCVRSRTLIHRYAAAFGLLAALLTGSYAYRAGLLGSAWRGTEHGPPAAATSWKGDPVLIVVFDELANDVLLKDQRIDAELFPNFAALAADSAWFPNATTNHMFTKDSFPCMLTGRLLPPAGSRALFHYLPPECGVVARDYFGPTYAWMRTHGRSGQTFLLRGDKDEILKNVLGIPAALADLFRETPFSRPPFAPRPARRLMPPLLRGQKPPETWALTDVDDFLSAVNSRDASGKLLFWHSHFPHAPFRFNPDGSLHGDKLNSEFVGPGSGHSGPLPQGHDPLRTLENYRKQVRFADRILGRLVEKLKSEGLYDKATLVVTSDHGVRTWGAFNTANWPRELEGRLLRVPLMIRGPRVKNGAYLADYQHVDFTPTLLDALGLPYDPAAFEGFSGFAASRPARAPVFFNENLNRLRYDAAADVLKLDAPR